MHSYITLVTFHAAHVTTCSHLFSSLLILPSAPPTPLHSPPPPPWSQTRRPSSFFTISFHNDFILPTSNTGVPFLLKTYLMFSDIPNACTSLFPTLGLIVLLLSLYSLEVCSPGLQHSPLLTSGGSGLLVEKGLWVCSRALGSWQSWNTLTLTSPRFSSSLSTWVGAPRLYSCLRHPLTVNNVFCPQLRVCSLWCQSILGQYFIALSSVVGKLLNV